MSRIPQSGLPRKTGLPRPGSRIAAPGTSGIAPPSTSGSRGIVPPSGLKTPGVRTTTSKTTVYNRDGSKISTTTRTTVQPAGLTPTASEVGLAPRIAPSQGRPSFGGGRPSFGSDRLSIGGGKPSIGGGRPSIGGGRPSIGGGRPSTGGGRPSIGRPSTGATSITARLPTGPRPGMGGSRPSTGVARGGVGIPRPGGVPPIVPNINVMAPETTPVGPAPTSRLPSSQRTVPMKKISSKHTTIDPASGKKTIRTKQVIVPSPEPSPERPLPYVDPGTYILPMKYRPYQKEGKGQIYSSPAQMRAELEDRMPKDIRGYMITARPGLSKDPRIIRRAQPMSDVITGSLQVLEAKPYGPSPEEQGYYTPSRRSMLDRHVDPSVAQELWGTPMKTPRFHSPTPGLYEEAPALAGEVAPILDDDLERSLIKESIYSPGLSVSAKSGKQVEIASPIVMTPKGPQQAFEQLTVAKSVRRTPESEIITRKVSAIDTSPDGRVIKTDLDTGDLVPTPGGVPLSEGASQEVMGVSSTISFTPEGQRQTKKTVMYEVTKPKGVDPGEIAEMVREETEEVEQALKVHPPELKSQSPASYPLKKRLQKLQLNNDSVAILEQSLIHSKPTADEEQEELQPELMAAIMHTEERGVTMGTQPTQMYNILFPEAKPQEIINVSPVAPQPLQDAVVPMTVPSNLHVSQMTAELTHATIITQQTTAPPADDIYAEVVMKKEGPKVRNVAKATKKKRKKVTPITSEEPPWGVEDQDLRPLVEVVGADVSITAGADASLTIEEPSLRDEGPRFEYMLQMDNPKHISRVQLRGSQHPAWFPGYIAAFPEIADLVRVERSPSRVFHMAWKSVQPNYFPEDSFVQ